MREIPLTQGKVAIVDDEDYETLSKHKWCAAGRYAKRIISITDGQGRRRLVQLLMHRAILAVPAGSWVDHINGNGLDNRRCNLRPATPLQNVRNSRRSCRTAHGLGYRGVRQHYHRFSARIGMDRRFIHLGMFPTAIDAARAYDAAAIELYGEFAQLNFPTQQTSEARLPLSG